MPRLSSARFYLWALIVAAVLVVAGSVPFATAGMNAGQPERLVPIKAQSPQPVYAVAVGLQGDVFPALANFGSFEKPAERETGTVSVTIKNPTDSVISNRVTVQIPGWSDQEIQLVEVGAGQVRTLLFAPTFYDRLYENREIAAATAVVTVTDMGGHEVYSATAPARLRSVDDIYWGKDFENARFIASWVTPHDPDVEEVLSRAKELMPGRRLPGYENWKTPAQQATTTYAEVKAIYRTLQQAGISYVKSSTTLGPGTNADVSERVRMPREALRHASANCIDSVVLYASLFENLGMDPVVVLIPGHAYLAVRLAEGADNFLTVDVALTGRVPFETAVKSANTGMQKYQTSQIIRIPIAQAREAGIYPMPLPGRNESGTTTGEGPERNTEALN